MLGNAASDHRDCRTDLPDGCPRCVVVKPVVCCELCSPAFFENFAQVNIEKSKPVPSRSRIKEYIADVKDMNLRDALHIFRRQTTQILFGLACLKNLGPGVFMSNEVLQRIVDCAHEYKIETRDDLAKETRWTGVQNHAVDVITLINTHCPKPMPAPLLTSTPLRSLGTLDQIADTLPSNPRTVKLRKCSKCGSHDHICTSANNIIKHHLTCFQHRIEAVLTTRNNYLNLQLPLYHLRARRMLCLG
jgi:hypothetical protein